MRKSLRMLFCPAETMLESMHSATLTPCKRADQDIRTHMHSVERKSAQEGYLQLCRP